MNIDVLMESKSLFQTSFPDGYSFTWRLLTLKEYSRFKSLIDTGAMHEYFVHTLVFERVYIGNAEYLHRDLPAGIPIAIGQCAMWLSGDSMNSGMLLEDIAQAREAYAGGSIIEYMKIQIFNAWPTYIEEDVDSWTYADLIRKFTIAENILRRRNPEYVPLDLRKIAQLNDPNKKKGVAKFDDLNNENRELRNAMGDETHPLDKAPDELARIQKNNQGKLSRQLAKKLDNRRR